MSGPEKQVESAMHFFRALRVYPNPVELLMSESSTSLTSDLLPSHHFVPRLILFPCSIIPSSKHIAHSLKSDANTQSTKK